MGNIPKVSVFFLFMLLLGFSEARAGAYVPAPLQPAMPEIKRDCTTCHVSHGSGGMLVLKEPVTQLCIGCHPDRKGSAEHKIDVVPSSPVPGLPLIEGKIACITCHDPHSNNNGKMLRIGPEKLCLVCHKY